MKRAIIFLMLASPCSASTVVWNALEDEWQRQPARLFAIAPKGCRTISVMKNIRVDQVEPLLTCGTPEQVARMPSVFDSPGTPITTAGGPGRTTAPGLSGTVPLPLPGRIGGRTTAPRAVPPLVLFSGEDGSGRPEEPIVRGETTDPSPTPLPAPLALLLAALVVLSRTTGFKRSNRMQA